MQFNVKTVLFQTTQFTSIQPIDRTLSCANIRGQSRPSSDSNKGVFCIPQSSSITGPSPSDCLVSYPGHSWWWVLLLSREAICVIYLPSQVGKMPLEPFISKDKLIILRRIASADRDERVNHICEYSKVAQKEYKTKYNGLGKAILWELCKID